MKSRHFVPSVALLTAALATLFFAGTAGADTIQYTWSGTSSTAWTNSLNWSSGSIGATGGTYDVRLNVSNGANNPLYYTATQGSTTYSDTSAGGSYRGLVIGNNVSNGAAMVITGGTLSTNGSTAADFVGNGTGIGTLTIQGGVYVSSTAGLAINLGQTSNGTGIFTMSGGSANVPLLAVGAATLVQGGTATMNLNGGTLTTLGISNSGSLATFNFNGGTLLAGGNSTTFLSGGTALTVNVQNGGALISPNGYNITIPHALVSTGSLTTFGAGVLSLSGTNTYSGGTNVNAGGTVSFLNTYAEPNSGSTTVAAGATLGLGVSASGTYFTAANIASLFANTLPNVSMNANSNVGIDTTAGSFTYSTPVTATTMGLAKLGPNTLTLTAANLYTGTTTLSGGSVNLGIAETPGTSGPLGNSAANNPGSIVLNGGFLQYTPVNQNDYSGRFSTANNQAYNVDTNSQNVTWATPLTSNGGSLSKVGSGTLFLTAGNTYTGTTTLSGGTLNLGVAEIPGTSGPLGKSAASNPGSIILGGGYLQYSAADQADYSGRFSAAASQAYDVDTNGQNVSWATPLTSSGGILNKVGGGMLTLTGSSTYSGATTISGGTLQIGNGTTDGSIASSSAASIAGNSALVYDLLGSQTYGGVISGSGGLTKSGSGLLTLTGNNTYTGTATLSGGTLNITTAGLIGSGTNYSTFAGTGAVEIGLASGAVTYHLNGNSTYSGGTTIIGGANPLYLYSNSTGTSGNFGTGPVNIVGNTLMRATNANSVTVGNAVTLGGNFTMPAGGAGLTFTGPLTLSGSSLTFENDSSNALAFSGGLGDGGSGYSLTKAGSGTLVLSGSNTYSGGTAILAGTLQIGSSGSGGEFLASPSVANSGMLTFSHSDALAYTGLISGAGSLAKQGAGTLTLTGSNTYTGTTTLGGGTLNLGAAETAGASGPLGNSAAANPGSIILGGGFLQYSAVNQNDYSGRFSTANNQAYNVDTNGQNVTWATALTSSGGSLTKVGAGMLTLTASNTYAGPTTVGGGTLDIANQYALQNSTLTVSGGTLVFDSSVAGNVTAAGLAGTGGYMALQNDAATPAAIVLTVGGSNASTTCAANLGGSGSLIKIGSGALTLSGSNTFSGGITLSSGTLDINTATALGSGPFSIAAGAAIDNTSAGIVTLSSSNTQTWNSGFSYLGTVHSLYFGNGAVTMTTNCQVSVNQYQLTEAGNISDGGQGYSLTKSGTGILVLGGSNTYTGPTAITAGTLSIGSGGSGEFLASPTIANNAWLFFNHTDALTYGGLISGAGSLAKQGAGTLTLTAPNTYTGTTTLSAGTVNLGAAETAGTSGPLGNSAAANPGSIVFGGGYLQYSAANQNDYSGRFSTANSQAYNVDTNGQNVTWATPLTSASGSLTKVGLGTLTLTASNTYTGKTTLSAGTVNLGAGETAGASGPLGKSAANNAGSIVLGGGYLQYSAVNQNDYSGRFSTAANQAYNVDTNGQNVIWATPLTSSGGSLSKVGAGTLTLTASNTYAGATTVYGGTLDLSNSSALQNSTLSLSGGGAVFDSSVTGNAFTLGGLDGSAGNLVLQNNAATPAAITLTVGGNNASATCAVNLSGSGSLTKVGNGLLTLTGSNTYTGTTTLSAGTVNLGAAEIAGVSGPLGTSSAAGSIVLGGGYLQYSAANQNDYSARFSTANSQQYNVDTNGQNVTWATPLTSASGSLTKIGSGSLTLTGSSTYSGATTISAGTLSIGNGTTDGSIAASSGAAIANNATLQYNLLGNQTYAGAITGAGALTKNGSGMLTLSGNETYYGTTTLNSGTLNITGNINPSSGSGALFTGTAPVMINMSNGQVIYKVSGNSTYSGGTTISGGTGTLVVYNNSTGTSGNFGTGPINITANTLMRATSNAGNPVTIGNAVTLGANLTDPTASPANNLTFAGPVTLSGSSQTLENDNGGGVVLAFSGGIGDGGNGYGITKQGTGTVVLSGSNTYTGVTNIIAGTLQIGNGTSGESLASQTIADSGTLAFNHSDALTYSGAISGSGALTKLGGGALTLTANNTYTGATTIGGGTLTLTGSNSGTGATTISSAGTLDLSNQYALQNSSISLSAGGSLLFDSSVTGNAFTVGGLASGNIVLQNNAAIPAAIAVTLGANNATTTSAANLSGSGGLTKVGSGALTLSGNSSFSGGVTLTAGTLAINSSTALGTGMLTIGPGTAIDNSTTGVVTDANNNPQTWNGNFTYLASGGHSLNLGTGAVTLAANCQVSVNNSTTGLTIGGNISGSGFGITKAGGGTLFLAGSNGYSGGTTVSAGILEMQNANALGATSGAITLATNAAIALGGGITTNPAYAITINGGSTNNLGQLQNDSGSNTWAGPVTLAAAGIANRIGANAGTLTVSGQITGTGGLLARNQSNTSGILVLSNSANNYSGGTGVLVGTLQLGANNALPFLGGLTMESAVAFGSANTVAFDLNGYNQSLAFLACTTAGTANTLTNSNTNSLSTLTLTNTAAGSFAGNITGNLAFVINGSSSQLLSGSNSYTGGTTINGATLQLGNSAALGAQTGSLTMSDGTLNLNSNSPALGALTGNALSVITDTGTGGTTQSITVNSVVPSTYAGTIGNEGGRSLSLVMSGNSMLTLSGTSNYHGTTTVSSGTLQVARISDAAGASSISSGAIVLGGGAAPATLRVIGSQGSNTLRAITLNGTATIDSSGTGDPLTFTGPVTSSGNQNLTLAGINEGDLFGPVNLGSGTLTVNSSGAGLWSISGTANTIGAAVLNSGMLVLANSSGSALGSGNLTINGGTLTTGGASLGAGSISGTVYAGSGPYVIAPGAAANSTFGDLTLGGLSTSSSTTLHFDLGSPVSGNTYGGDLITISNSGTLAIGLGTNLALSYSPTAMGDYRLLADSNTSALTANASNLTLSTTAPSSVTYALNAAVDPGYLDLVVAAASVGTFSGSATWVSTGSSLLWSNSGNWTDGANHGVPGTSLSRTADTATFNGSDSATAINLDVPVSLAALSFSGTNYTLSGSGSLTMNAASGTATVSVSGGSQQINSAVEISGGSLAILISNSGVLGLSGIVSDDTHQRSLTLAGDGSGTLILSNSSNSYTGGTYVNSGTLIADASGAIPEGSSLTVGAGAAALFASTVVGGTVAASPAEAASRSLVAVPEPASVALLLAALGSAAIYRRLRRPKALGVQ